MSTDNTKINTSEEDTKKLALDISMALEQIMKEINAIKVKLGM